MNTSFTRLTRISRKHSQKALPMQCFALIVFLGLTSCVSNGPSPLAKEIPPGLYRFECEKLYSSGMAEVTHTPKGVRVQLLEKFKGSFELRPGGSGRVNIANGDFSYPGLKRSFSGDGLIKGAGLLEGTCISWINSLAVVKKDHRKDTWLLRKASQAEAEKWNRKQQELQDRMKRAGML